MRLSLFKIGRTTAKIGISLIILVAAGVLLDRLYPPNLLRLTSTSKLIQDKNGKLLTALLASDGRWRFPISHLEIDPLFVKMLLTYEDKRYFYHPGVDPFALFRALWQWAYSGHIVSGGSSLTMQTVRLLERRPRTFLSKFKEILRALQLELHYSKEQILEFYLMLAPYGGNLEGIVAASLTYFGKMPKQLTPAEAAFLVVLPQSPNRIRSDLVSKQTKLYRDKVLLRMQEKGILSASVTREAIEDRIPHVLRRLPRHALHLAYQLLQEQDKEHKSVQENKQAKQSINTTLDKELQSQVEKLLNQEIPFLLPGQSIAVLVVENKTRQIQAYVGSVNFLNEERAGAVNMIHKLRSPGSLLKPFIYGMAFDAGFLHPETWIDDVATGFSGYRPGNFKDIFHGRVKIKDALKQSLNIPAVAILDRLGPGRFYTQLRDLNIQLKFESENDKPTLPLALGGVGMTLWDLVSLYCILPNEGIYKPLTFIKEPVKDLRKENNMQNDLLAAKQSKSDKVLLSSASSWHISRILEDTHAPDGFVDRKYTQDYPIAYKTGTSYGYRDAWAMGYNQTYTVGIWVGKADGTPSLPQTGRIAAAPLLFKIFDLLPKEHRPIAVQKPESILSLPYEQLPLVLQTFKKKIQRTNKIKKNILSNNNEHESRNVTLDANFKITFPLEDTIIQLERNENNTHFLPIKISLVGGEAPFHFLVNGRPKSTSQHPTILWQPDSPGFVELTVLDKEGRGSTVNFQLQE